MKRSRQDKTVAEKLELLNRYKALPSVSQRKAAESLGISRGFLQNLIKNEAAMRAEDCGLGKAKRKRVGKNEEVENALYAWFKFACNRNVRVNGPILMQKANDIAQAAGHEDFKATCGWFSRWKKRCGLTFSVLKGELAEADIRGAEKFRLTTMQDILKSYSPEKIYNADKTVIHFRALPESTYVEKAKKNTQKDFKKAEPEEAAPSAAEMRECLRCLAYGLNRTAFKDIDMFYCMKRKIDDHLRVTFTPKQTSLFQLFASHDS